MLKLSQFVMKCTKNGSILSNKLRCLNKLSTTTTIPETRNNFETDSDEISTARPGVKPTRYKNNIVAAAFASLHSESESQSVIGTPFTDEKITKAETVDELLSISTGNGVSRKHAFKVVSVLAEWSSSGKVSLSEFENDVRFLKLCKILTKGTNTKTNRNLFVERNEDLSTILSVTADDEAAKLVATITVPQMVKVMTTLSQKKRRSTLLLRALSFNITASNEHLDIKQSADLLYSMSVLNFIDNNLFMKVCNDTVLELEKNGNFRKSSVIGSILTSLGLLKYKNTEVLDSLSNWILENQSICRPNDLFSFFMTLAVLNYIPTNSEKLFKELLPQMTISEARRPTVWLEFIWSLVLLNKVTNEQISKVLAPEFVNLLEKVAVPSSQLKLLNINAAVNSFLKNYNGAKLAKNSSAFDVEINRTKEKTDLVNSVIDTLRNLIQTEDKIQTNINTGFGFLIDAKCILDKKLNMLTLNSANESRTDTVKVAIMTYDFHDMCVGRVEPTGLSVFARKLLEAHGYRVLVVPYTEFNPRDKLVHRVKYLELKLKEIVK